MRSETQPYSTVLQYGCVALRMRFFPQNFGTIKRILPGSSSPSHRKGPGTEVGRRLAKLVPDWFPATTDQKCDAIRSIEIL